MVKSYKKTSLKDIAAQAGVSPALVSFVLNGKRKQHRIREDVAEKIVRIAKEMNYAPNSAAKSLRGGKSYSIGVVLSDISNPFFSSMARHIETAAEQRDYTVQFSSSDENADREEVLIESMLNRGVDCLIVVPCDGTEEMIGRLSDKKIPLVLFDRYFPKVSASYVCLDNRNASFEATTHLVEQGFKRIGMIAYGMQLQHMNDRIEGYKEAMRAHGLENDVLLEYVDHDSMEKSCSRAIGRMMENGADSLIFATNNISVECLTQLSQKGVRIPDEMGLVGFDGGSAFDFFYSPLTYIQQPVELMARKAVEILLDELESGESLRQRIEVKGSLIKRASSMKK